MRVQEIEFLDFNKSRKVTRHVIDMLELGMEEIPSLSTLVFGQGLIIQSAMTGSMTTFRAAIRL